LWDSIIIVSNRLNKESKIDSYHPKTIKQMKIRFLIGAFFFFNITVASTLLERHNVIKMFSKATKDYSLIDIKLSRRIRTSFRKKIERIFEADTVYITGYLDYDNSEYSEYIWSCKDSLQYTYQFFTKKIYLIRNEVTDNFRQDIEDIQLGYFKNTKEFKNPSFVLKIAKNNSKYTIYELYKSGEQHNLKKPRSTP